MMLSSMKLLAFSPLLVGRISRCGDIVVLEAIGCLMLWTAVKFYAQELPRKGKYAPS